MLPYFYALHTSDDLQYDRNAVHAMRSNRILWEGQPKALGFVLDWYVRMRIAAGEYVPERPPEDR